MHAARWAFVGDVKREIKAGANVDAQDSSGFTAMIWNLRMGGPKEFKRRKRIWRVLLKAGARPTIQDLSGLDALGTARKFSNKALKRFVIGQLCRPCPSGAFSTNNQSSR
jgi:ankyrin repeat protein